MEIEKIDLSKVKIGGVEYNLDTALKRLKQDLRDDWFPDFLEFQDILDNKTYFLNQLKPYTQSNDLYEPSPALHFDIPKPGYTVRWLDIQAKQTLLID